jgi:general stress protein 26
MNQQSDGHEKTLTGDEAARTIRELAKSARVCLFATPAGASELPVEVRPMAVQAVDPDGSLWFLSGRSSIKNRHITRNPHVQLFFANPADSEYLSVFGTATVSDDRSLREKHWTPLAKDWFPGGIDDPELTVIKVEPDKGHYWDTEHGKAVSLIKATVGALTGKPTRVGVEGELRP